MSFTRFFEWICNICETVERKEGHGFIAGWTYFVVRDGGMTKHACAACVRRLKLKSKDDAPSVISADDYLRYKREAKEA